MKLQIKSLVNGSLNQHLSINPSPLLPDLSFDSLINHNKTWHGDRSKNELVMKILVMDLTPYSLVVCNEALDFVPCSAGWDRSEELHYLDLDYTACMVALNTWRSQAVPYECSISSVTLIRPCWSHFTSNRRQRPLLAFSIRAPSWLVTKRWTLKRRRTPLFRTSIKLVFRTHSRTSWRRIKGSPHLMWKLHACTGAKKNGRLRTRVWY